MPIDTTAPTRLDRAIETLTEQLLAARVSRGHWEGHLSSSALSTATAVIALELTAAAPQALPIPADLEGDAQRWSRLIEGGVRWLAENQNTDGGWGDTVRSRSNLSTTLLSWAALSLCAESPLTGPDTRAAAARGLTRVEPYLTAAVGAISPSRVREAVLRRYGKDRTFSVPILTVLAITGRLGHGPSAWRLVPQLPFELAVCPHQWFQWLRLPVVSYALPALIAIGQVRHRHAPTRNPVPRALRRAVASSTRAKLLAMQPASGGYLEATPLTSFVVMSLVSAGHHHHAVVRNGIRFLEDSVRADGSWPIDTNLATWLTTLSVNAVGEELPQGAAREALRDWLLAQQHRMEHPFTHAAPGGWAWTDLTGGVPDADDTAGALLALHRLGSDDPRVAEAAVMGVGWLLGLQNRDGGIPTFCRGWGALPFDRSAPDLTAHALQAWLAWHAALPAPMRPQVSRAIDRAVAFLVREQRSDGAWRPLWFGNEHAADEANPVYGTSRVLTALSRVENPTADVHAAMMRGAGWLVAAQNDDGGWGGERGTFSSVEETGVACQALAKVARLGGPSAMDSTHRGALDRGVEWLLTAVDGPADVPAAPIGLYFARLWYFEALYPAIFALAGLQEVRRATRACANPANPASAAPDTGLSSTL